MQASFYLVPMIKLCLFAILALAGGKGFANVETHYPATDIRPSPAIHVTVDMCGGQADMRLLDFFVQQKIPVTLFISGKWLKSNAVAISYIQKHPEIFSVQNHGLNHKQAVFSNGDYALPVVGNQAGLIQEVQGQAEMQKKIFGTQPTWYRTAGALYEKATIEKLHALGWKIAGYTLAIDGGGKHSAAQIKQALRTIKEGDIVLIHGNRPNSPIYLAMAEIWQELLMDKKIFAWLPNEKLDRKAESK